MSLVSERPSEEGEEPFDLPRWTGTLPDLPQLPPLQPERSQDDPVLALQPSAVPQQTYAAAWQPPAASMEAGVQAQPTMATQYAMTPLHTTQGELAFQGLGLGYYCSTVCYSILLSSQADA